MGTLRSTGTAQGLTLSLGARQTCFLIANRNPQWKFGMKSWFAWATLCGVASVACWIQEMDSWVKSSHSHLDVQQHQAVIQPSATAPIGQASIRRPRQTPTSAYKKKSIHGFTILINPVVFTYPQTAQAMQAELTAQLAAIAQVMPAKPLAALRKVRIWVEWDNQAGAAEFHPSAVWLRQHGYNPDKAGCVEVANTRNFIQWSRAEQPWLLLHELAHAYHHLVLGDDNAAIQSAYRHALDQGLYQSVPYIRGTVQKAYALVNDKEYFAELSEAYFGKNDFYPFTRTQLQTYDQVGYQLMEKYWGQPWH